MFPDVPLDWMRKRDGGDRPHSTLRSTSLRDISSVLVSLVPRIFICRIDAGTATCPARDAYAGVSFSPLLFFSGGRSGDL